LCYGRSRRSIPFYGCWGQVMQRYKELLQATDAPTTPASIVRTL